jgi:hypothetical protein
MTITINQNTVVTVLVSFFLGALFAFTLDIMATPTPEEIAAEKAEQEMENKKAMMEMEMMMKVMGACPIK